MQQKLADKVTIPFAKMPKNVVGRFSNSSSSSSSASIPSTMPLNLADKLKQGYCRARLVS